MDCEETRTHLPDHLTGSLPPPQAEAVATHLRSCAACAADVAGLEETWQTLGTIPSERPDSAAMRARFRAMLEGYQQGASPGHTDPRAVTAWAAPARYAAWLSSAAALLILGAVLGRQTAPQPSSPDPQIAALRDELRDMRQMVTLSLLQQQSASERLKGVTWTGQIDQPSNEITAALLDTLLHDPNDNVRLRTVDALKRFADHETVRRGAIDALAQQTSPIVQVALIDFVLEVGGRDAADALRRLSSDPMVDEAVRARAAQGLARLGA
jgi:HEAT repeat protein